MTDVVQTDPPLAFGKVVTPSTGAPIMYSFKAFLEKMKDDRANDIVAEVVGFINEIVDDQRDIPNVKRFSDAVHGFMVKMEAKIRSHDFFRDAPSSELENTIEGLEKYLMTRLFDLAFAPNGESDIKRDDLITRRIASLGFIKPKHVDISDEIVAHPIFQTAQAELLKITTFKAPRDKLIVITNCCKILTKLLTVDASRSVTGADEFIPLLIYTVLRSNPPRLKSHLEFISYFRNPSKLTGESAYFFTNLNSALQFIENCTADSFSIDPDVYESSLKSYLHRYDSGLGLGVGLGGLDMVLSRSHSQNQNQSEHESVNMSRSGSGSGSVKKLATDSASAGHNKDKDVNLVAEVYIGAVEAARVLNIDIDTNGRGDDNEGDNKGEMQMNELWSNGSRFRSKQWEELKSCEVSRLLQSHQALLEYVDNLHEVVQKIGDKVTSGRVTIVDENG